MEFHGFSWNFFCVFTIFYILLYSFIFFYHFPPLVIFENISSHLVGLLTLVFTSALSFMSFLLGAKEQAVRRASARQKTKEREALRALWAVWTSELFSSSFHIFQFWIILKLFHWFHCHLTDLDVSFFIALQSWTWNILLLPWIVHVHYMFVMDRLYLPNMTVTKTSFWVR